MDNELFSSALDELNTLIRKGFFDEKPKVLLENQQINTMFQTHYPHNILTRQIEYYKKMINEKSKEYVE